MNRQNSQLRERLGLYVPLTTALLAVVTAICSYLQGRHGGQANADLIRANDQWSFYQAKSIKSYILRSQQTLLEGVGKPMPETDAAKLRDLEKEQEQVRQGADGAAASSERNGELATKLGYAMIMFQLAIANGAIAAVSKRAGFWLVSLGFAAFGVGSFVWYFLT